MALPAGIRQLGTFQGAKGDTGSLAFATAELVPWTASPAVTMVGPEAARGAHFEIPMPIPGPATVNNDDATELLMLNPTKTQAATETLIDGRTSGRVLPLPDGFDWSDAPIRFLWDGRQVRTDFDVRAYRPTGGATWYVDSVNGSTANPGTSESAPFDTLATAVSNATDGDTIMLLDRDVLWRANWLMATAITKSVSIVAKHPGLCMVVADLLTYSKTTGADRVWQTTRSSVLKVVDIAGGVPGVVFEQVSSLAACDATPGSWWQDGSTLYVHAIDGAAPDPNTVLALLSIAGLAFQSATVDTSVYMEGVNVIGGNRVLLLDAREHLDFYAHGIGLYHSVGPTAGRNDALVVAGARNVFLQGCEVLFSNKDAANYASADFENTTRDAPHVIEVDCHMGFAGLDQSTDLSCNASTAHTGSKVIRVGGVYEDTMGGVVCDVHTDTQSVNVGITVKNSRTGLTDARGSLLSAGQGAQVWSFAGECFTGGETDLYAEAASELHARNTWHFTSGGDGTVDIT